MDGAQLQRGQHRRRHRKRVARPPRGLLRQEPVGADPGRTGSALRAGPARTDRVERLRHRPEEHRRRQGAALHQPAHVVLLPRGSPGHQRRRAERLRRAHLGPVLHLPGLQRAARLDAHLERRRQHRRVRAGHDQEGRCPGLHRRRRGAAGADQDDHRALQDGDRHGREDLHRLPHAPRPGGAGGERQDDRRPPDGRAAQGADPVLQPDQGPHPRRVQAGDGGAHQLVEQHALRRRRRQHRLLPLELRAQARSEARLVEAGGRQRAGQRLAGRPHLRRDPQRREPRRGLGLQHQQLALHRRRPRQPEARRLSLRTSIGWARTRAASTPCAS